MEAATLSDVALDIVAALEMFGGDFGADGVHIASVTATGRETVLVSLTNGEDYELTVEAA